MRFDKINKNKRSFSMAVLHSGKSYISPLFYQKKVIKRYRKHVVKYIIWKRVYQKNSSKDVYEWDIGLMSSSIYANFTGPKQQLKTYGVFPINKEIYCVFLSESIV